MKKLLVTSLAIGGLTLMANSGMAGITGSSHDLSAIGGNNTNSELCVFCHTPHNGLQSTPPLWNHNAQAGGYTPYGGSGTLNATVAAPAAGTISFACLSCHDGTLGLDAIGGVAPTVGPIAPGASTNLGLDLTDDHPIAFTFDGSLATEDGELWDPTTHLSGLGGTIAETMLFGATNDRLECASCHDVHNGTTEVHMLLKDNTGSNLCLTCHNK